jgi:hypothetical protein
MLRKANSAKMFFFILFSLLVISTDAHAFCALTDDPVFDVSPSVTIIRTNELEVAIKIDPPMGINPLDVGFSARTLKGTVKAVLWDFGDGFTCAGHDCTHTFEDSGSYVVRLTVSGTSSKPVVKKLAVFVREKGKEKF